MDQTRSLMASPHSKDLNIAKEYARNMKFVNAIYEFVMNAMDQQFDPSGVLRLGEDKRSIIIQDHGTGIKMSNFVLGVPSRQGSRYSHHGVGMKMAIACCFCEGANIKFTTSTEEISFEDTGTSIHAIFSPHQDRSREAGTCVTISNIKNAAHVVNEVRLHFLELIPGAQRNRLESKDDLDIYPWPEAIYSKLRSSIFVDGVMKKTHQQMDYLFNFKGQKFAEEINENQGIKTGRWKTFRRAVDVLGLSRYLPQPPPPPTESRSAPTRTIPVRQVIGGPRILTPGIQVTVDSILSSLEIENAPLYSMSQEQREHLNRARGVLHNNLRHLVGVSISEIRNQGSVEKNTAIPFDADLDIVIYLNDPTQADQLRGIQDIAIFREGSSDILTGLYRYDGQHYAVDLVIGSPERGDGPAHVQTVLAAVGSNNYVFEVMRMIKYLFKRHLVPFKSFLIEKFVLEAFESIMRPSGASDPQTLKRKLLSHSLMRIRAFWAPEATEEPQAVKVRDFLQGICDYLAEVR
jgi:hypothetical protein